MLKNLKKLRLSRGLSQASLGSMVGASQQTINRYENQETEPDIAMLIRLADVFDTSVDYIIGHSSINHKIEPVYATDLNQEEIMVMESYRDLGGVQKETIKQTMKAFADMKKVNN